MRTAARTFASELVATLKLTAPVKPMEVARSLGLEVQYCNASGFDGALVCSKENHAGTILVEDSIRETGRVRFTIAHEIAHYVLPHHGVNDSICRTKDVESWDESLPEEECEANVFAGELLIPEVLLEASVSRGKPTFEMIRDLSRTFDTSLTASAYRAMGLTTFRAAIVWSTGGVIRWFKASEEFEAFVAVHDRVPEGTYACVEVCRCLTICELSKRICGLLVLVDATHYIFEHSVSLPSYDSVLTLLYIEEVVTSPVDEEENLDELHPEDFTLNRRRWPR
jgi:Zn-dependent peptidase ImmA (M78 family)